MKKNTSKTTSPAPATNAAKPAKKKAKSTGKATPAAVPLTPAPAASPVSPLAPAKPTASTPTIKSVAAAAETRGGSGEPKPVAPAPVQTKIVARIDVGFGNALYVRGDGPGLNWSQGVPMQCVASDEWVLTLGESARPISFKVLINDATWCSGPDTVVASGSTVTITPDFA